MKINRLLLKPNVRTLFEEEIDFSSFKADFHHVRRIDTCKVKAYVTDFDDLLIVEFNIVSDVIASCAYTLDDVPYKVRVKEKMTFTSDENISDEDVILVESNEICLDDYVLSLILASVPHNLHKEGASLPKSGDGYRVLTEEEFEKERSRRKKDSPFDVLDSLDL